VLGRTFQALLIPSLAGTVLTVFLVLFRPWTKKHFGYLWHYYIWLTVLLVMLLPVRFPLAQTMLDGPETDADTAMEFSLPMERENKGQAKENGEQKGEEQRQEKGQVTQEAVRKVPPRFENWNVFEALWLVGAGGAALLLVGRYIGLVWKVHRKSYVISCPQVSDYTKRNVTVRKSACFSSPFLLGILRPTLVLPDVALNENHLRNVLRHEITHLQRGDLFYKWLAALVRCIHWFNPVSYYVLGQIGVECEIACDLSVVSNMDGEGKHRYVDTILFLLYQRVEKQTSLMVGLMGSKQIMKRRMMEMKNLKPVGTFMSTASLTLAALQLTTSLVGSGVAAYALSPEKLVEMKKSEEVSVLLRHGTQSVSLAHAPFVGENQVVYLPLRETLTAFGFADGDIRYDPDITKELKKLEEQNKPRHVSNRDISLDPDITKELEEQGKPFCIEAIIDDDSDIFSVELEGQQSTDTEEEQGKLLYAITVDLPQQYEASQMIAGIGTHMENSFGHLRVVVQDSIQIGSPFIPAVVDVDGVAYAPYFLFEYIKYNYPGLLAGMNLTIQTPDYVVRLDTEHNPYTEEERKELSMERLIYLTVNRWVEMPFSSSDLAGFTMLTGVGDGKEIYPLNNGMSLEVEQNGESVWLYRADRFEAINLLMCYFDGPWWSDSTSK